MVLLKYNIIHAHIHTYTSTHTYTYVHGSAVLALSTTAASTSGINKRMKGLSPYFNELRYFLLLLLSLTLVVFAALLMCPPTNVTSRYISISIGHYCCLFWDSCLACKYLVNIFREVINFVWKWNLKQINMKSNICDFIRNDIDAAKWKRSILKWIFFFKFT